jgi:ATP-dependent helicase HepA
LQRKGSLDQDSVRRFVINALAELGVQIDDHPAMPGVYNIRLRGKFLTEFPQFAKEGLTRQVTFDPSVARDYETIEFLAFGHELVDALVERVRKREYGGRTSNRIIKTDEQSARQGWLFTYALEFDGVLRSKEVLPVFVDLDGKYDPELSVWLVERAARGKREEWGTTTAPDPDERFEAAVETASRIASERLLRGQVALSAANRERLEQERVKLERFYGYRTQSASEKLDAVRRTFDRVSLSEDPEVQRIIPVWAKNFETAKRVVAGIQTERTRRLNDLIGLDQVTAQQELLTASFVDIQPEI